MIDQLQESYKALKSLEKVDLMLENSYQRIYDIINEQVIIPFVTMTIPIGQIFYRARLNNGRSFKSKSDISHNTNLQEIKIGRANYFNQSVFYASHKEKTAIFETSQSIKNREIGKNEIITVGKWVVNKPIEVIPIIHDKEFQEKNEILQAKYLNFLKTNPLFTNEWIQAHFEFISNQFARKVNVLEEYKISCAFFNVMKERKFSNVGVSGILYPTIEWEKNDLNIALTPECADNHLSLLEAGEFIINIHDNKNCGIVQVGTSDCLEFRINDLMVK
ncbi:hypothetical protein [Labilibaculum sp.]|uniref:hypothetical protein n=1 Tax=Labilibaculum sp. TaxID=2060723 RepID=UPI002AA6EEAC|nr:hypothetical protein [Labilibaculum sp.]